MALNTKTVANLITAMAYHLQEDSDLSSNLWTSTEVLDAVDFVQGDFLFRTGIRKVRNAVAGEVGVRLYSHPASTQGIDRITWRNVPLHRTTRTQIELEDRDWRSKQETPRQYHEDGLAKQKFQTDAKVPHAGNFHCVSTAAPTVATATSTVLTVHDPFFHYIKWGVMDRLLRKNGEGQDLARAEYCRRRYLGGVRLAQILMGTDKRG